MTARGGGRPAGGAHPAGAPVLPRRLSPTGLPGRGMAAMMATQVRSELLLNARVPEFLIGIVANPVMLYLMFGLTNARITLPGAVSVATMMIASFGAYGMLSLVIFSFGVNIAQERGRGWLRLMRATPVPAWVYFVGKSVASLVTGLVMLSILFAVAALFAGVRLPLSFASGSFMPLSALPEVLQRLASYLPTYHFGQLVWRSVGAPEAAAAFTATEPEPLLLHLAWLVGTFVVFGALAIGGHRRERSRETT